MFNNDLTLNPTTQLTGATNAAKIYSLIEVDGGRSLRRVSATAATTPELLTISHETRKSGAYQYDAHLVRSDIQETDPVKGLVQYGCRLVLDVPRGTTVVTSQKLIDCVGRVLDFIRASGNLDKFINSEP
jgi:hypothetical protein